MPQLPIETDPAEARWTLTRSASKQTGNLHVHSHSIYKWRYIPLKALCAASLLEGNPISSRLVRSEDYATKKQKTSFREKNPTCLHPHIPHASHRPNRKTRLAFSPKGSVVYATVHAVIVYSVGGSDWQAEWERGSNWEGDIIIYSCAYLSVNHCIRTLNNRLRAPGIDLRLLLHIVFLRLKRSLLFHYALCNGGSGTRWIINIGAPRRPHWEGTAECGVVEKGRTARRRRRQVNLDGQQSGSIWLHACVSACSCDPYWLACGEMAGFDGGDCSLSEIEGQGP